MENAPFREKKRLRNAILKKRNILSASEVLGSSLMIHRMLLSFRYFLEAQSILFYFQYKNEVETKMIIKRSIEIGKKVSLPVALWEKKDLYLTEVKDIDKEIAVSDSGIPEPKQSSFRPVECRNLDMIIVPGVSFDTCGNRLGYGCGFYDRLLQRKASRTTTVGFAYEFQLVKKVPTGSNDMPIDFLITEKRTIDCRNNIFT